MPALETQLNARSADFQANAADMQVQVDDFNKWLSQGVYFTTDEFRTHLAEHKAQVADLQALVDKGVACAALLTTTTLVVLGLEQQLATAKVYLEKLARLGNMDQFGNSDGNVLAQQALKEIYETQIQATNRKTRDG